MVKQTNIVATVFGGKGDEQPSAYSDVAPGWPNRPGVALPYRFTGPRQKVRVYSGTKDVLCDIVDVGPWNTKDAYWINSARPQSESGVDMSGRHTNKAGIDLTPAAADALGIMGKGVVDWEFGGMVVPSTPPASPATKDPISIWGVIWDLIKALLFPASKAVPPAAPAGELPWMTVAKSFLGFHEKPNNTGLEELIALAKTGQEGDPWCAIFVNASLEKAGIRGSRSPAARSFEHDPNFTKLAGPAMGAIVTNWRNSPSSGLGHVYFYAGENANGVYALGGNQDDQVKYQYEPRDHIVGYYWPSSQPQPKAIGPVEVPHTGATTGSED